MSCMPRQHRFGSQVASAETPSEISRPVVQTWASQTERTDGTRAREAQLDSNENEEEE